MTDLRALRLALKDKLNHRRRLLTENTRLRSYVRRTEAERDFLLDALKSPLVNALMEDMADEIANAVIEQALKASEAIAQETMGPEGAWEVGISIPALHIRHALYKRDLREIRDEAAATDDIAFRRVRYDGSL